jgi:hypothetical protein
MEIKCDLHGSHLIPRDENDEIWDWYYSKKVSVSFDVLNFTHDADVKVWIQIESPSVIDNTAGIIGQKNNFDLILTFSDEVLNNCNQSKKFIFGGCMLDLKTLSLNKKDEISYIMSSKNFAPGHRFRHEIWDKYSDLKDINGLTTRFVKTGPFWLPNKNELFENAKFHIVVENLITNSYITEKIVDCFLSKTVPIYWGCSNIGEFFNTDGILQFNNLHELDEQLNKVNSGLYEQLTDVIEENYQTAQKYKNLYVRIDDTIKDFILTKYGNNN